MKFGSTYIDSPGCKTRTFIKNGAKHPISPGYCSFNLRNTSSPNDTDWLESVCFAPTRERRRSKIGWNLSGAKFMISVNNSFSAPFTSLSWPSFLSSDEDLDASLNRESVSGDTSSTNSTKQNDTFYMGFGHIEGRAPFPPIFRFRVRNLAKLWRKLGFPTFSRFRTRFWIY